MEVEKEVPPSSDPSFGAKARISAEYPVTLVRICCIFF